MCVKSEDSVGIFLGIRVFVAAGAIALLSAATVSAATFNFGAGSPSTADFFDFTEDGIQLQVSAGRWPGVGGPAPIDFGARQVFQGSDGLGAVGVSDATELDGAGGNDVLIFTFDHDVVIEEIVFGSVDDDDNFAFGLVVAGDFLREEDLIDVSNSVSVSSLSFAPLVGASFGIGAKQTNDNFTILQITVSKVPLPASALVLLIGLGGLAAVGSRKAQRQR
ncbi:MAG: hypothetical protein AAF667_05325 [Pseudomonadota bacterium]